MALTLRERFDLQNIPEPNSGCYLWTGNLHRQGYGFIKNKGKGLLAHRVSWELNRGPIPDGMNILHSCDNTSCVNPDHLSVGTQSTNMKDMFARGRRSQAGEKNNSAKLTKEQVKEIRQIPFRSRGVAKKYGVTRHVIYCIRRGKTWKGI